MGTYLYGSATQNQPAPAPVNPSFNGNNGVPLLSYDPAMSLLVDVTKSVGMGLAPFAISALKQQTSQNPLQQVANIVNRTTPAPRPTPKPPVATVTQPTTPATYNQPYAPVTNVTNTSVNIPDLFKATPMLPPQSMEFQPLSAMPQAQAARLSTNAGTAPIPAAVSMGSLNLPMAAAPPVSVAQGSSPVNLIPQQARADQPLPPVSPEPLSRPSRPIEMPPVAPRYAQPPMAPPNPYGQMPPMNPYARPPMPMPPAPMYSPPFNPGEFMPNLQPPRQFYQPPPPPRTDLLGRLGRGLQRFGAGLNPNIAAADMAKAKAEADVRMKMLEMDSQNWRNAADNTTAMMREMMQQGGQDRRTSFTQDNENYRAQLQAQAQGKLSQSQGYEMLGEALKMTPQNQADYVQKFQMLSGASQALGQDFTGMLNQTSTAGSEALMQNAIKMKREAMAMLKDQNELQMQPIENDIKRLQKQRSEIDVANAPLDRANKMAQAAKTQYELANLQDPVMQKAARAEALAKSEDVVRRKDQDALATQQHNLQMASSQVSTANQVLMNPFATAEQKAAATALLRTAQQRQAVISGAQIPLTDPALIGSYLQRAGGDKERARALAKSEGYSIPGTPEPTAKRIGMR